MTHIGTFQVPETQAEEVLGQNGAGRGTAKPKFSRVRRPSLKLVENAQFGESEEKDVEPGPGDDEDQDPDYQPPRDEVTARYGSYSEWEEALGQPVSLPEPVEKPSKFGSVLMQTARA